VKVLEAAKISLASLSRHKLRAFLTMLGVIFGVGAVIAMLSIGAGAQKEALSIVESMGTRNIIVEAKEFEDEDLRDIRKKSLGLTLRDAAAIREVLPSVERVIANKGLRVHKVIGPEGKGAVPVAGVSPAYKELARLDLAEGVFFDARDAARFAQVCVLGQEAKRELFGFQDALGGEIKVNDLWFRVIGVLQDRAFGKADFQGVKIQDISYQIFIPIETATRKFRFRPLEDELDKVHVQVREAVDPRLVAGLLADLFEDLHGGEEDTTLVVPVALLDQSRRTQRIFNIVMSCIAGISLLVGGIGIMNIMLASVLERTREIGIRRAVGARQADIRRQFLSEALIISLLGGLVGVALGVTIARIVALGAGWTTVVTLPAVLLAFGVCFAVGLVFGYYPAAQASKLDPITALRHE